MNLRETGSKVLVRLKGCDAWFFVFLFLAAVFLFLGNLTVQTFPQWPVGMIKKYGVMSGLVLMLAYLLPQFLRGRFSTRVPWLKVWLYFGIIAGLLSVLLLGRLRVAALGIFYAQLTTNFWSTDFTGEFAVLLKRVAFPALAHLFGFHEGRYIDFWLMIYLGALWLAVRFLIEKRLGFLECLSLLTSSLFAFELMAPGYVEVLILALALYCLQRRTGLLEKVVILTLALATHEVAACFIFLSVVQGSPEKEREEWFLVFPSVVSINVLVALVSQILQNGARPGETLVVGGLEPYQWIARRPLTTLLGVFIAYKLYWLVVLQACRKPSQRLLAGSVFLSLPLIVLGTDTSRLIQFSSLSLFLLVPAVVTEWSARKRTFLALANLLIPSLYAAANEPPTWGWGLYNVYYKALTALSLPAGMLWPP